MSLNRILRAPQKERSQRNIFCFVSSKIRLSFLILAIVSCVFVYSESVLSSSAVVFDFTDPSQTAGCFFDNRFARVAGPDGAITASGLRFDTFDKGGEWNCCFYTKPGLFQPGKSYRVRLRCRTERAAEDSFLYLLIRPVAGGDAYSDLAQRSVYQFEGEITVEMQFTIPAGNTNYAIQVHTRKQASGYVKEIRIAEKAEQVLLPLDGAAGMLPAPLPNGASAFSIDLPRLKTGSSLSVADCGASTELADNSEAFKTAIARCAAEGISQLTVPPGVYRFTSDAPLSFKKLTDFELDGRGSTFQFFKKRNALIEITDCERVRFKDLIIDWDWEKAPLASRVTVEESDPVSKSTMLRFNDYENFPARDTRIAFLELLDPETQQFDFTANYRLYVETFKGRSVPKYEWLDGRRLKVSVANAKLKPGALLLAAHYYYDMPGVSMNDNEHLTLQDVTLYSCPGMGFLGHGQQHHWQLIRAKIVTPPGSGRPTTCTADHLHVGNSKGFLKMEACEFSRGNDDFINIHDTSAVAIKSGEKSVTARNTASFPAVSPGDRIELLREDFTPSGFIAPLTSAKAVPKARGTYELQFDETVPGDVGSLFVMFNRRYDSGQILIRGCRFFDAPGKRFILSAHDVTFESNSLELTGPVKLETGYTLNSWCEGYGASNVVIRGNDFQRANAVGRYVNELRPAVYMSSYIKNDPSTEKTMYPILSDFLIEGNRFLDCPGAIAFVCSARNVIIRSNRIENTIPGFDDPPYRGAVGVSYSSNVFVTGNRWLRSPLMPQPGLRYDPESAGGVHCWSNEVVDR
ncbi:MAG: right-handed parallel beta-helix repeat-containing protein [Spirochaetes bacterium]|nr:right-handed parallel beta-helix repeat-containing protein [Spirochaetota bacterium]